MGRRPWLSTAIAFVLAITTAIAVVAFVPSPAAAASRPISGKALAPAATAAITPTPSDHWTLGDKAGTTAADTGSPGGHPGTVNGSGVAWGTNFAWFAGVGGTITAPGPVADTTKSFSVAAWVDSRNLGSAPQTMLVQQAGVNSGFYLEYNGSSWQFAQPNADTSLPAIERLTSTAPAVANTWTHLVGTFDAGTHTMTFYVNGVSNATATNPTPIASSGPLVMGRGFWNGSTGNLFNGAMADVRLYQQALTASDVQQLYQSSGFAGSPLPGIAGALISDQPTSGSPARQLCMDDIYGNTTNSTSVVGVWDCNHGWTQAWSFRSDGTIRPMGQNPLTAPTKCLDTGGSLAQGAKITLYDCVAADQYQQWKISQSASTPGHASIVNPASGLCLDDTSYGTNDGNQYQLYQCVDNTAQRFLLPAGTGQVQSAEAESVGVAAGGGTIAVQTNCCNVSWSNGAQQLFDSTAAGSQFTLNYYVANPGTDLIDPVMTKAPDFGTIQVSVDGQAPLPKTFDAYSSTVLTQQFAFGAARLSEGMHSFTFTVTGTNAASINNRYDAGIDVLTLVPSIGVAATSPAMSPANTALDGRLYTASGKPTFSAVGSGPVTTNQLTLNFQILSGSTVVASGSPAPIASGGTGSWTPAAALADGAYTWQVQATDGTMASAWTTGAFTVDTTTPPAPTLACPDYPANVFTAAAAGAETCTWTESATDINGYTVAVDGVSQSLAPTATSVTFTPAPGWHTITARAVNDAGTTGATAPYAFGVGTATVTAPTAGSSSDGTAVALSATSYAGAATARFQYRTGTTGAFTDLPVGDVTGNGTALTAWPVPATAGGSVTGLVWNAAHTLGATGGIQIQAVFADAAGHLLTSAPVGVTINIPTPPTAPTNLSVVPRDSGAIATWAAPSGSGPAITGYTVTVTLTANGTQVGTPVTVGANVLTTQISGLTNGTAYTVAVTAADSVGTGPAATAPVTPVPASAPGAVTGVTATPSTAGATIAWTAPTSDGGANLTSTVIEVHASVDNSLITTQSAAAPAAGLALTGLPRETSLYVLVHAVNAAGLAGPAVQSAAFTVPALLKLTGLGTWSTTDPSTAAPMTCLLWQFAGAHFDTVTGTIHYQKVAAAGGSPDATTDWSVAYTPAGNYSGSVGEYSWCADTSTLPASGTGYVWTPVSFTADDANGGTVSLTNTVLAAMTMLDPDGHTDSSQFTVLAAGAAALVAPSVQEGPEARPARAVWHLISLKPVRFA